MAEKPILRMVPPSAPRRWLKQEVLDRLSESDVRRVYQALGVKQFKPGGPKDWKVFCPWRDNTNTEAMTVHRADGLWDDKALGEGGSIFDAVMKAGLARTLNEAIEWVVETCGFMRPEPNGSKQSPYQTITYDYTDEVGTPLYRAERIETIDEHGTISKRFHQKHWRGEQLVSGLGTVRRVPYNLAAIADPANRERTVYLVEGEKCAELLAAEYGLLTTTFVGASWVESYAGDLDGRAIVILADRDVPGWKKASEWAENLSKRSASLKLVDLVELGPRTQTNGLDVADWIQSGLGQERLLELVAETAEYVAAEPEGLIELASSFLVRQFTAPKFLVQNLWTPNSFGVIAAAQKSYKSFFVVDLLCSIASGTPFLGRAEFLVPEPARVVYWMEEGSTWDFQRRVLRWCDARFVEPALLYPTLGLISGKRLRIADPLGMQTLAEAVEVFDPALIVCDTLAAASVGLDENKTPEMALIVDNFKRFKDEFGCAVVYVHHTNRSGRDGFAGWRGSGVLGAAADVWVTLERKSLSDPEITIEPGMKDAPPRGKFKAELRDAPVPTVDGGTVMCGALFFTGEQSKEEAAKEAASWRYEDVAAWIDDTSQTGWASVADVCAKFSFHAKSKAWESFRDGGILAGWWSYCKEPVEGKRAGVGSPAFGLLISRSRRDE